MNEPRDADSVAARLKALRSTLGLSQEQLARRLGVSFATVNRWESGRTQASPRALRVVAELEVEVAAASPSVPQRSKTQPGPTPPGPTPSGDSQPGETQPTSLPLTQTSFIGRQHELSELADLIRHSRLVSLIGPGGAGKTRLAVELINRSFSGANLVFVPLESVRPPRTLASALASQLGVHDQPGVSLQESLQDALTEAPPRLLVLDGAEALRDEATSLAGQLLAAVPDLRIVVTSRVLLGVPGEVCWTVPPLACPSLAAGAAEIAASDAVQLFIARASDRLPAFHADDVAPHAIAELCRRLDGLPLAIELIASWVGTLSIQEILQQRAVLLDSGPARSGQAGPRGLADVLQASYDLLEPVPQRLLPMLSVFGGSFALADARAVLDVAGPPAAMTIRNLVDSSWLVVSRSSDQNRFGMLETIKTFTAAQLERTGDGPAARERHARHFGAMAIASENALTGPDATAWTTRLESAVPDLQLALHWAEDNDLDLGLDMAAALWRWWLLTGRLSIGRGWLAGLLRQAAPRKDERTGPAMSAAAVLAAENGDYHQAIRHAELSLEVFESLGMTERMAFASTVLASAHRYIGDNAAARRSFQDAMDLRIALGDRRGVSVAINNMALLELDDGNLERARELFERALAIKRELGERRSIAIGLANLADVLIKMSQWEAADRVLTEGAELAPGIPQIVGTIRCNQGNLAVHRQQWAVATEHFQAAIAASQAAGHPHDAIEAMIGIAKVQHLTGRSDEALRQLKAAAELTDRLGNPQRAAEVRSAVDEVKATYRHPPLPADLTARQAEVLGLLAAGLSNKEIAAELVLSLATVERHLATIYRKLGLSGRVEATRFAIEKGLVPAVGPRVL